MMEVEIWSDINCPWCYIGKRRFEAALAQFDHADEVNVTWRSFELDPSAPADIGGNSAKMLAEKYGVTAERAQEMEAHVTEVAAGDGLEYNLEISRLGNTFDGHRLVHLAGRHGLQDAMKERLLRARFTDGLLVSDPEVLIACAVEVGLDADEVRQALAGDSYSDEVRADEQLAHQFGISGVPMFVVDRAVGASGAQPPELLLQLLEQGWEQRPTIDVVAGQGEGEACGVDGC
jgi:predicted DsbA family dithiol-disulfide isomerase